MTVGVLHLHLGVNGKQQILLLGWMQLSFPFSPSMLRFCPFKPDWKVWRVSMVEGNCYFSSLAFHRQGRRWARQAPRSTWKGSKKTGRGHGGLWTPTQQVRGSLKSISQLLSPRPSLCQAGAVAFLTVATEPHMDRPPGDENVTRERARRCLPREDNTELIAPSPRPRSGPVCEVE